MESIIERINQGKFWHFHGGIHPPEQKSITSSKPIKPLSLPKQLVLPLQQHIGRQGDLLVKVGDKVLKGQALTQSSNPMAVPVHAPTSGIISAIEKSVIAHPSGLSELCLFIDVDGEDTWKKRDICLDYTQLSQKEIIKKIADAGIAGMGGAGFPTHIKVDTKPDINFLIINAAECEPYITADDLLMCEQSTAIVDGIKILNQILNPAFILIGIEDNKPQAIKALQQATQDFDKIKVCVLPTKYPTGGEKQLIKILTGKEVNSGTLPINSGIVVQNVATCFAISDAVINDIPLIRRVVTLTGKALSKPQNVWALLGTQVSYLLEQAGFTNEVDTTNSAAPIQQSPPVIMGGPLMGFSILNEQVPIVKTSNCILAPSKVEMPSAFDNNSNEMECIRCGQCADVCPSQLLPQELQWSAKAKDQSQLMQLNLFDCIDCGACAYVCPSQIPLVQYYRVAKAEIRQQQQLDIKAEKAKARFEARKLRLNQEKIARQEKHEKAAAARKAAMNKKSADGGTASSAVAAALARVKAKKANSDNNAVISENNSQKSTNNDTVENSPVKAAIARAKAKRLAKEQGNDTAIADSETAITDDKQAEKSQVKAAIARAKAKRLAKEQGNDTAIVDSETTITDDKQAEKSQVKAAIARAKAKKLAKEQGNDTAIVDSETPTSETALTDDKQAEKSQVKAAIARAKAKKLAKEQGDVANEISNNTIKNESETVVDDKKARIAAAVAKAKAKKAREKQASVDGNNSVKDTTLNTTQINNSVAVPNNTTAAEDKKARIAAAVAKAKEKARLKVKNEAIQASTINREEST